MSDVRSIEHLFGDLVELPTPEERGAYLDRVCRDDPELRGQLERLLADHDRAGSFLNSADATADWVREAGVGEQIGPYKLREQIGEGGMGTVYVAEQAKPLRRKVALKVIKPGMDSKAVIARFEAERQALALMEHPNIARVLDAGTTDQGRPYFVMELIQGQPITEHCDDKRLTIKERLALFTEVCQAVQHAHQKGVIHRDIKPSNVLVTEIDGKAVPKVIDFGVAKALGSSLTDQTVYTNFQTLVGTPLYMSPEQAKFSGVDVDTRSDVYSLGVLLYELLTGTTPLSADELKQAAQDEVLRRIRETEPPRPSNRISALGGTSQEVSECRGTQPDQLGRLVRGDLDWVVMKALEKDRKRRYATAVELGEDVDRFLSDQPVGAYPPSTAYRARKFVRRNRGLVGGAAGLAAVLVTATIVASWGWMTALREKERANSAVIERLMLQALAGELEHFEERIEEARDLGVPEDWLLTLQGVAHVHQAEMSEAVSDLKQALKENPDNVSAKAMLSFPYFLNGNWEDWNLLAAELKDAQPRPEYEEFDRLFLGYGFFYIDYQESADRLRAVLAEHPTWYIPRAVHAIALAHAARQEWVLDNHIKGDEHMRNAVDEMEVPLALSANNPFVLTCCFYVYQTAALRENSDRDANLASARDLAERIRMDHREYAVGSLLRAIFHRTDKNRSAERDAWKDMLDHGNGALHLWPAAAFLDDDEFDIIQALEEKGGDDADLARAYVLALSGDKGERDEAIAIFDRLKSDTQTWFSWHTLIQVPLLAGRPELVKPQCRKWIENGSGRDGIEDDSRWEMESLQFLASGSDRGLRTDAEHAGERWFAHYQQGMLAMSKQRWREALDHFTICNDRAYYARAGFRRFWTTALEDHLQKKFKAEGPNSADETK